jgi:hypothetical protein
VLNFTLQPFYLGERTLVAIEMEAGWAPEVAPTLWEIRKSSLVIGSLVVFSALPSSLVATRTTEAYNTVIPNTGIPHIFFRYSNIGIDTKIPGFRY